jgi:hypothetical protein
MTKVSTPNEGDRYQIGVGAARGVGSESKKKLLSSESFEGEYIPFKSGVYKFATHTTWEYRRSGQSIEESTKPKAR